MDRPLIDLADGVQPLDRRQLEAYFAFTEVADLLAHQVERQLRADGDLSAVQFQILMRLASGTGRLTMTELADGVVYSRSGLTYQAGLLEQRCLITRAPSPRDERSTLVTITDDGVGLINRVLPGHIELVRRLLFEKLAGADVEQLAGIMARVRSHMRAQPPRSAATRSRSEAKGTKRG